MASPSDVLTFGVGSWGSPSDIITLGFGSESGALVGTWSNVIQCSSVNKRIEAQGVNQRIEARSRNRRVET